MKRPRNPQPHEVLTTSEVARWLDVSERTVERHYPSFLPGRYLVAHVLEVMARQAGQRKAVS